MPKTEITYYEDELNYNYIELMKKFIRDFPPYGDPDGWLDCSYYWELTRFLNKRESWLEDKMKKMGKAYQPYQYIAPNKCKKPGEEKGKDQEQGSNKNEIIVKIVDSDGKDEEKFRLKSDQFGFSVGESRAKFNRHPYGYLCKLVEKEKKTKKEKDEVYEVIAKCIYHTRTLGGGFLWQVDANNGRKGIYEYNTQRGRTYIEDRVDLTLLEIKHLFEWIELKMPEEKDASDLFNKIGDKKKDKNKSLDGLYLKVKMYKERPGVSEYIKWLEHFGTFENYIKFFCFDDFGDFVDKGNWMPCDIMKSNLKKWKWDGDNQNKCQIKKRVFLEDPTEYKLKGQDSYKILKNKKLSAKELEQMLENVRILTLARSYRMQEVIDGISD